MTAENALRLLCAVTHSTYEPEMLEAEFFEIIPEEWKLEHGNPVNLDDYDYAIRCPAEWISEDKEADFEWNRLRCWGLNALLVGCCENQWYLVTIDGKQYGLGVAYHA